MSTQERTPSLTTVDICYIHIHPDIQVRTMVSDDALERYTEIYKSGIVSLPPIKICISAETQEFFLIDGHHRLNAARAAGLKTIPALDYGEMTLAEMISESIRSNCEQGLALSKADRKRAAEMLAKYNPQITVRDAAQRVGLSKSLVATVLKEYREKTVVQCCECKATVLRLYAEDSTNGWVQVPETKRDRWFCCEDHRREFYAKQAEKEAAKQARREALEEERNAELDDSETVSEPKSANITTSHNSIPESQRDYDPKPSNDPGFILCPCHRCGSKAYYSFVDNCYHIIKCSNPECKLDDLNSKSKDQILYDWNSNYRLNQERHLHEKCPHCGHLPEIFYWLADDTYFVQCENPECLEYNDNVDTEPHHSSEEAWKAWDEYAKSESEQVNESASSPENNSVTTSGFILVPCYKCNSKAVYKELSPRDHEITCSNPNCDMCILTESEKSAADRWNLYYKVNQDSHKHKPCPFCGAQVTMEVTQYLKFYPKCENEECLFNPSYQDGVCETPEEAWKHWDKRSDSQSDSQSEKMFADLLLKFLRKGYKWKQNGHTFYLELQSNAFAGKDGFLVIRSGGLKGCAALQSTYLLPDLTTPKTSEEAEK